MSQPLQQARDIDQAPVDAPSLLASVDALLQSAHAQSSLSGSGVKGLRLYRLHAASVRLVLELDFQATIVYDPQSQCVELYPDLTGVSRRYPRRLLELILNKPASFARQRLANTHGIDLSPRDQQILYWLSRGHSNKQIARRCVLVESTVKNHLSTLYKRLHVTGRAQAIASLHNLGLLAGCERHAFGNVAPSV